MANFYPLVVNRSTAQIEEIQSGDNLTLTLNNIVGVANITAVGNTSTQAILTDNYLYANGVPVDFGNSNYSNANVSNFLPTNTSNVGADNLDATGDISAAGNVAGNNLSFTNLYVGNTLFTRTLVVGTRTAPAHLLLASNNTFNVLTRSVGNVAIYTS